MSRPWRSAALAAGVVLAVGLVAAMGREVARRGRFAVPLSSFSTATRGTKALAVLAETKGRTVRRWSRDLTGLPRGQGVLLAVGEPWDEPARTLSPAEEEALGKWIDGGGTVVVLGAAGYLPESLGVLVSAPDAAPKDAPSAEERRRRRIMPWNDPVVSARLAAQTRVVAAQLAPDGLAGGLGQLWLRAPAHLKVTEGEWERVATSPKDDLAVVRIEGRGRIAVVASASFVTNGELARGDHAALALRLLALGRGPVLLDEYHLGMASTDSMVTTLRKRGFGPALLQAALVLALLLWRAGARFGRPLPPPPPVAADATTYVDAVGRIYARAGDVRASMERLAAHALARVAARHGVHGADAAALAKALRDRGRARAAAAVEAVAARLGAARTNPVARRKAPAGLVAFTRGLDDDIAPALSASTTPALPPSPEAQK